MNGPWPYQTLTIAERISLLRDEHCVINSFNKSELDHWLQRGDLFDRRLFQQRLKTNDWSIEEYAAAISSEGQAECSVETEDNLFLASENWIDYPKTIIKKSPYEYIIRGFLNVVTGRINQVLADIKIVDNKYKKAIIRELIGQLSQRLLGVSLKTILVELNAVKEKNSLVSEDSQDRLIEFAEKFGASTRIISFYKKSALLTRKLSVVSDSFSEYVTEILVNLNKNWNTIEKFALIPAGQASLRSLSLGKGDTHHHGRTVAIFELSVNSTNGIKRLVYKPRRSLSLGLVEDINEILSRDEAYHKLRFPESLGFDDFTIFEFIEQKSCLNMGEVNEYFYQFGQLIALCYLLNITDMHYENIIACGSSPVPIDLETCFAAPIAYDDQDNGVDYTLVDGMRYTVLASLLLPVSFPIDDKGNAINLSALNGKRQKFPVPQFVPVDLNTDNARFEAKTVYIDDAQNRVSEGSRQINPTDHAQDILHGLRATLNISIRFGKQIIERIKKAGGSVNRILLRDTNRYARLLDYSYHPNAMKDTLSTEKIFENLYALDLCNKDPIESEIQALNRCDIPIFYSRLNSDHIFDDEMKDLGKALRISPMQACCTKISRLTPNEVERQCGFARSVILGDSIPDIEYEISPMIQTKSLLHSLQKSFYLSQSHSISGWISVENNMNGISPQLAPADFYDGLFGVALVFIEEYKISKDISFLETAKKLVDTAVRFPSNKSDNPYIGVMSGLQLLRDEYRPFLTDFQVSRLLDLALDYNPGVDSRSLPADWLTGYSSYISLYSDLFRTFDDSVFCIKAGSFVERITRDFDNLLSSMMTHGMGHGLPGILTALTDFYKTTNDDSCLKAAKRVLRAIVKREDFNSATAASWCNGIGGTLLAIANLSVVSGEDYSSEIDCLLRQVKRFDINTDCLCHGRAGLIVTYRMLAESLKRHDLEQASNEQLGLLNDNWKRTGYVRIRHLKGIGRPGLFTGLSGVAYAKLYIEHKDAIPAILL